MYLFEGICITRDFNVEEWYNNMLKSQHKPLRDAVESNSWIKHGSHYKSKHHDVLSYQEEHMAWSLLKPVLLFRGQFGCYIVLDWATHALPPYCCGWLRKAAHSVDYFRESHLRLLNWHSCLSTMMDTLWCWDKFIPLRLSPASLPVVMAASCIIFWALWAHWPCLSSPNLLL